jgi:hypothetical protein
MGVLYKPGTTAVIFHEGRVMMAILQNDCHESFTRKVSASRQGAEVTQRLREVFSDFDLLFFAR